MQVSGDNVRDDLFLSSYTLNLLLLLQVFHLILLRSWCYINDDTDAVTIATNVTDTDTGIDTSSCGKRTGTYSVAGVTRLCLIHVSIAIILQVILILCILLNSLVVMSIPVNDIIIMITIFQHFDCYSNFCWLLFNNNRTTTTFRLLSYASTVFIFWSSDTNDNTSFSQIKWWWLLC